MSQAIPEIELELSGNKYIGVFSTRAFCVLEEKFNVNTLDPAIWLNVNMTLITQMLWAALITNHPEITLDFVRDNISFSELQKTSRLLMQGFKDAMPPSEPSQKKTE